MVKNKHYMAIKANNGKIKAIHNVLEVATQHRGVMPMSVGTGSIRSNALLALEEMNMSDWFEGLVTAEDVQRPKPHPETFIRCAEIIGVAPEHCQVFEDAAMGIKAGLAAGMKVVNIVTGELFMPN
jgi:beta-phosphoglucomutase-like phosphatase (HAD superfamily)